MISLTAAVTIFVYILIAGLVFWLLFWALDYIGIPEPFNKIARVILVILAVLVAIGILLSIAGGVPLFRP